MRVFKYFEEEYRDNFAKGRIFVNTFAKIKKMDATNMIGDPDEARVVNKMNKFVVADSSLPEAAAGIAFAAKLGVGISECKNVDLSGLQGEMNLADAYMFCVTLERQDEYWKSKGKDACVEIKDFIAFSDFLHKAMMRHGLKINGFVGDCFYESNIGDFERNDLKEPNYLRKTLGHEPQKESRCVFTPIEISSSPLKPFLIGVNCKDLITFIN